MEHSSQNKQELPGPIRVFASDAFMDAAAQSFMRELTLR